MNKNYMYDYELFKQGKHYIRLETKDKYDKVMKELEELGFHWTDGSKPTKTNHWWWSEEESSILMGPDGIQIINSDSNLLEKYKELHLLIFIERGSLTAGYLKYNEHYSDLDTFTVMRSRAKNTPLDPYEFSLALNINKYVERMGKKDDKLKELNKIKSYADEWIDYLKEKGEIE